MKAKHSLMVILCLLIATILSGNASATTLVSTTINGDEVVYDTANNRYWIPDLSFFIADTFSERTDKIEELNTMQYGGISTWELSSRDQVETMIDGYVTNDFTTEGLFFDAFFNPTYGLAGALSYEGIVSDMNTADTHFMVESDQYYPSGDLLFQYADIEDNPFGPQPFMHTGAWVSCAVPVSEPTTIVLLGAAILGLTGVSRKKQR